MIRLDTDIESAIAARARQRSLIEGRAPSVQSFLMNPYRFGSPIPNSLELHFEGTAGTATFTDSSPNARTPTINGSPVLASSPTVYAGNCGNFTGTNWNLTYSNFAGLDFGTGPIRIRVSFNFASMLAQNQIYDFRGNSLAPILYTVGNTLFLFTNSANRLTLSTGILANTNYTVEINRNSSGVWSALLNGASVGGTYNDGAISLNGCIITLGAVVSVRQTNGYIDEFIVSKG